MIRETTLLSGILPPERKIAPETPFATTVFTERCGNGLLTWKEIKNTTSTPLPLSEIEVFTLPKRIDKDTVSFRQMGWQSWSLTTPSVPLSHLPQEPYNDFSKKGPKLSPTDFPWMTTIEDQDNRLLVGFVSTEKYPGIIHAQENQHSSTLTVAAKNHTENVIVPAGHSVTSEKLFILPYTDEQQALREYASLVANQMKAKVHKDVPTGWSSWYEHFTNIPLTQDLLYQNLDYITAHNIPVETIHIDDGYQKACGDWLEDTARFPDGFKRIVDTIHAKGKKAGVWWAPFLVEEASQLFQTHPDWLVKDSTTNAPLPARHLLDGPTNTVKYVYALDATHPEVKDFLRDTAKRFAKEYGFDLLKLDFLYTGMLEGKRYDTTKTSLQSYREALQIITQESDNAYILACGAPYLPSVGLVDGMRVSADTEFFWEEAPNIWKKRPGLHNIVRSILSQQWMHNILWHNDGDALTFREHHSHLTLPEIKSLTSLLLLTGGPLFLGDDLPLLEKERAALLSKVVAFPKGQTEVFGKLVDGIPSFVKFTPEENEDGGFIAGLFNWSEKEVSPLFTLSKWTNRKGVYDVFDAWNNTYVGRITDTLPLPPTAPHGVQLLYIRLAAT